MFRTLVLSDYSKWWKAWTKSSWLLTQSHFQQISLVMKMFTLEVLGNSAVWKNVYADERTLITHVLLLSTNEIIIYHVLYTIVSVHIVIHGPLYDNKSYNQLKFKSYNRFKFLISAPAKHSFAPDSVTLFSEKEAWATSGRPWLIGELGEAELLATTR